MGVICYQYSKSTSQFSFSKRYITAKQQTKKQWKSTKTNETGHSTRKLTSKTRKIITILQRLFSKMQLSPCRSSNLMFLWRLCAFLTILVQYTTEPASRQYFRLVEVGYPFWPLSILAITIKKKKKNKYSLVDCYY